jgi:DNA-binding NtrC family response regulator
LSLNTERKKRSETLPLSKTSGLFASQMEAGEPAVVLAAYHRDGSSVVTMQPGVALTVGREPPADLVIADRSLSRRHAQFMLEGGTLRVEDLGSTNGTRVRGQQIERAAFRAGEPVQLGSVLVTAYVRAASEPALDALDSHDHFMAELTRELQRAKHFEQPASTMMVSARDADGAPLHLSQWSQRVVDALRAVDRVGLYSHDTLEVLLPQTGLQQAEALASAVAEAAAGRHGSARCGLATFPEAAAGAEQLVEVCRRALRSATAERSVVSAEAERDGAGVDDGGVIVEGAAMRALSQLLDRAARATLPVLLLGETGVGKEVMARAIHARGPRAAAPLVSVNCGAIPSQLVESTLFGHVRGAFTSADKDSEGVFGSADGGSVLLDEIGELPMAAQASLLRVLETGCINRVGSAEDKRVDVRVIAATHRDLEAMCEQGTFRRDLLYRINALTLHIPALRERAEEIVPLAERFLKEATGGRHVSMSSAARDALERHSWPGNIRELRNVIERAVVVARGARIEPEDLPERVRGKRPAPLREASPPDGPDDDSVDLKTRVRDYEARVIVNALRATGGNQTHAAKKLQVPLRTLVHKIKTLAIDKGDYEG